MSDGSTKSTLTIVVPNVLSLVGCIFNLSSILIMKKLKEPIIRIVIVICILDLTYATFSLTGYIKNPSSTFCAITGSLQYFGYLGSIISTCCFAHGLLVVFGGGDAARLTVWNQRYALLLLSSTIVLTTTFGLIRNNSNDANQEYCWQATVTGLAEYWIYIPPPMATIFCGICYVLVIRRLKAAGEGTHLELTLYPLILVICFLPWVLLDLFDRILSLDSYSPWLAGIADILWNSQGFLNAIPYGLSRRVFRECRQLCQKRNSSKREFSMQPVSSELSIETSDVSSQ